MSITKDIVTAEELLDSPPPGPGRHELIRGKVRMMTPAGFDHGRIIALITTHFTNYVAAHALGVVVGAETGFLIERNPDTVRVPDVAFITADRVADPRHRGYFDGAPDIAVEVVSPSDRMTDVLSKVDEWLRAACRIVMIADPGSRTITLYRRDGDAKVYAPEDEVNFDPVLPGLTLRGRELF